MEFPQTADFNGTPGKHNRQGRELTIFQKMAVGITGLIPAGALVATFFDSDSVKADTCVVNPDGSVTCTTDTTTTQPKGGGGGGSGSGGGGNTVPAPTQPSWNELIAKFCEGIPNRDDLANDLQNNSGNGGSGRMVTFVRECDITFNSDVDPSLGRPMTNLEVAIAEPGNNMTPNEAQLQWLDNYINNTLLPAWYAEHPDLAPVTDQDSDGVPDDIEAELGTNPNNPDTDGDGLTDGEEIYQPDGTTIKTGHELDTDGDGIIDALEPNTDLDGDGQSAATGDTNDQDPCIPDTHSAPCQATTATADTTDNTLSPTPPTTDPTPTTPGNSEATDRSNDSSTPLLIAGVIASLGLLALGFWLLTHRHKKNKTPPTPT